MNDLLERSLLDPLPDALRASAGLTVFDAAGTVVAHFGEVAPFGSLDEAKQAVDVTNDDDRLVSLRERSDGSHVALSVPRDGADEGLRAAVSRLVDVVLESGLQQQQLESELESMSMSSLALLEEAAMVTDVMTELSNGDSEREIVEHGLHSLVVGAVAKRGMYYRFDLERDAFELLAHVEFDVETRRSRKAALIGDPATGGLLSPIQGLLDRAASSARDSAILESVNGGLESAGPEGYAEVELLAAPVFHGRDQSARLLGVLLLADKRATSYSDQLVFGSHETKLASGLASMLAAVLGARMSAEFGKELEMAMSIQQQILPDRPALVPGFELAGRCETSGAVGGDYFDYLSMADGRTMCVVADVSGHNLASGMVMVSARSALRLLAEKRSDVSEVFNDLASTLYQDLSRTERFITAAAVAIESDGAKVEIVNAGHNDTMVFRAATATVERLPSEDTILGFLQGIEYGTEIIELAPGDSLVLYTDGVTEAVDEDGEMFDEERLAAVVRELGSKSAQRILDGIYDAVSDFRDHESGSDDITALVIKRVATGGDA